MKLTLSHSEVTDIVRKFLRIPTTEVFTLEILSGESPLALALIQATKDFPRYSSDQKIAAIRQFRILAGDSSTLDAWGRIAPLVGLADAKWAVENVELALANIRKNGKIK